MIAGLVAVAAVLSISVAKAEEGSDSKKDDKDKSYNFGLALTIGEGMYFIHGDAYRGPVSLEVVPSAGWSWFKFDLGLSTTLESIKVGGTNVGNWNFTFRPGGRLTPPMIPLYLRVGFPLQIQQHDFDWGVMFGLGADIRLMKFIGIVLEVDTTLTKNLEWGGAGVPLEFRAGVCFYF